MKQKHILRLESQLEQLVESAFSNLFGKRIRARDLALELARALEGGAIPQANTGDRALAPDLYVIHLQPEVQRKLLEQEPKLPVILSGHLVEMATVLGYQLAKIPVVRLVASSELAPGKLVVTVSHTEQSPNSTQAMKPVNFPVIKSDEELNRPRAQLIVDDGEVVVLQGDIVNIGRDSENHIVIDDPYVSRHHIQLRLREGAYLLFDINSQAGTFVNRIRVREHRLQSGDVVNIGKTRLLFMEEPSQSGDEIGQTQALDPYE